MGLIDKFVSAISDAADAAVEGTYEASSEETRTYTVPPSFAVQNRNGKIRIRGEDRDDVRVTITNRARDEADLDRVRVEAHGGDDGLKLVVDDDRAKRSVVVEFDVRLPRSTEVDEVRTVNGELDVASVAGDATVTATNGRVEVRDVEGYLTLHTENGTVTARDVTGIDGVRTANGAIDVDVRSLRDDAEIRTETGAVVVRLARNLDADVLITSSIGRIDAGPLGGSRSGVGGQSIARQVGDGGHELRIETSVGSVEIEWAA